MKFEREIPIGLDARRKKTTGGAIKAPPPPMGLGLSWTRISQIIAFAKGLYKVHFLSFLFFFSTSAVLSPVNPNKVLCVYMLNGIDDFPWYLFGLG